MNLVTEIPQRRAAGLTTCAIVSISEPDAESAIADRVVQAHGFRALGDHWIAISAADAHAIAATLLHRDLASSSEIMPLADASALATNFFDLVPEPHSYFTNGDWESTFDSANALATLRGWDPISDTTFDSGIVCVGDGSAAILWVQDED